MSDTYRDWDAAYLLGSLAPAERREFEEHLSHCTECSASVAELAALPGLLAKVPASEVESPAELPQDLLPRLVAAARRHRRRARGLTAGLVVASAAAAVAIALVLPGLLPGEPGEQVAELSLSQVVPSALSADVRLVAHDWGTSVEMNCTYAGDYGGPDVADVTYGLYLTDASGRTTQLATWTARPGRTVEPSGTTSLAFDEIRSVDVRVLGSGTVLLEGSPRGR